MQQSTPIRSSRPGPATPAPAGSPAGHLAVLATRTYRLRARALWMLGLSGALLLGCSTARTTPVSGAEAAAPTPTGVALPTDRELLEYRELTREDFRATRPPRGAARARGHVAAVTCAYLVSSPDLRFRAVRKPGEEEFTADVVDLAFVARMDPECSWWDVDNRFRSDDYVLEHEQIHFSLIELEARALNRRSDEIAARLRSTGPTGEAAIAELQRKFKLEFDAAVQRFTERTRRFDEATSLGFRPEAQAEWSERIQRELAE